MLKCREASALLSDRVDRPLSAGERLRLALHLAMCRACGTARSQFDFLHQAMTHLARRPPR